MELRLLVVRDRVLALHKLHSLIWQVELAVAIHLVALVPEHGQQSEQLEQPILVLVVPVLVVFVGA